MMGTLLDICRRLQARAESPEGQAAVEAWRTREAEDLRRERDRRREAILARFPALLVSDARHWYPRRDEWSEAMTWLLDARTSDAWLAGGSAIMCSSCGCGKSTAATVCAGLEGHAGADVRYLRAHQAGLLEREERREPYERADLLILDQAHQIGRLSPWIVEALKGLIDVRYGAQRTTLVLATLPLAQLRLQLGDDIIDRVPPALRWEASERESRRWKP